MTAADARRQIAGKVQARLRRFTAALALIQAFCAVAFLIDLALEFPDPRLWFQLPPADVVHLLSESVIMVLMFGGFALAMRMNRELVQQRDGLTQELQALRVDFDRILQARLDAWQLTAAQRDVALLCLRGLRISDIARLRGSAEGTVKAHMSAVFRAADVRTRSELVALFMEEFLDHGAASADPVAAQARARS